MATSREPRVHSKAIDVADAIGDRPADDASQNLILKRTDPIQRPAADIVDGLEQWRNPVEADYVSLDPIRSVLNLDNSFGHCDIIQID